MGGARVTLGRQQKNVQGFGASPKERDHSEDRGIDGRMGLELILGTLVGGGGWSGFS
jgi:hypothetical protein